MKLDSTKVWYLQQVGFVELLLSVRMRRLDATREQYIIIVLYMHHSKMQGSIHGKKESCNPFSLILFIIQTSSLFFPYFISISLYFKKVQNVANSFPC